MDRRRIQPDPNDRSAAHQEPTGRRHATENPEDRQLELTGFDAPAEDADMGDAGNGASAHGGDLSGLAYDEENRDQLTSLEASSSGADILPDQIQRGAEDEDEDEDNREITARPRQDLRPIQPDLLPEG